MTFAMMPPEIISARMYTGPGSGPMVAAASAWSGLSAEINSMATSYQAMITSLASEEWMGPASAAMVAAAQPYLGWLSATGAQAEQATAQARMAAAAFEQAFAMTVPPPAIAANRALLQQLVATNILGTNASAIATVEAQYGEMWAQDSLAMQTYAAQSAAATALEPFGPPPETTSLGGTAAQATAVAQATGNAAATKTLSETPNALNMLAASSAVQGPAAAAGDQAGALPGLGDLLDDPAYKFGLTNLTQTVGVSNLGGNVINAVWRGMSGVVGATRLVADSAKAAGAAAATAAGGAAAGAASSLGGLGGVVGGLGGAGMIGGLSVPSSWAAAPAAAAFGPVSGGTWQAVGGSGLMGALPQTAPHGLPGVPGVPAAGTAAGMAGRSGGFGMGPRYGFKVPVMPRMPL